MWFLSYSFAHNDSITVKFCEVVTQFLKVKQKEYIVERSVWGKMADWSLLFKWHTVNPIFAYAIIFLKNKTSSNLNASNQKMKFMIEYFLK